MQIVDFLGGKLLIKIGGWEIVLPNYISQDCLENKCNFHDKNYQEMTIELIIWPANYSVGRFF